MLIGTLLYGGHVVDTAPRPAPPGGTKYLFDINAESRQPWKPDRMARKRREEGEPGVGRTLVCSATNASMAGPNTPPMRLARPDRGISSLFRASRKAKAEVDAAEVAEVAAEVVVVWLRAAVPTARGRRWPCCRAVD